MITSTRLGLIEDIVISIVLFLVVSLRNTDGTVIQGANSQVAYCEKNGVPSGVMYLGETNLDSGFRERGFRYGRFDGKNVNRFPQCRFYFKYESATGLIVGFRYEESEPLACRVSGA